MDPDKIIELLEKAEQLKAMLRESVTVWVIIWGTVFPLLGVLLLLRARKTARLLVPCVALMLYGIGWPWLFGTQALFWIGALLSAWAICERRRQQKINLD